MTAQGIRDALRYGRLLGEAAAPVLHTGDLDAVLHAWERRPGELATPLRGARPAAAALVHGRRGALTAVAREVRTMIAEARERRAVRRGPLPPAPPLP